MLVNIQNWYCLDTEQSNNQQIFKEKQTSENESSIEEKYDPAKLNVSSWIY